MISLIKRYTKWLHTQWPAGQIEKLPLANEDGSTNVTGLYIVGDLTGIPLLKFSSHTGAKAVRTILQDPSFVQRKQSDPDIYDLVVVGAGVSGAAAIAEARQAGLKTEILEASEPFSTVINFPRAKPIYTYPTDMTPDGELQFGPRSDIKEGLVEELKDFLKQRDITPRIAHVNQIVRRQGLLEIELDGSEIIKAHRVIVAIGRSGNYRTLSIPGEDRDFVYNRLHDPKDFCGKDIVVIGGGDTALETAITLASCGSNVTLSYRKDQFSRPKPENIDKLKTLDEQNSLKLMMASKPKQINETDVVITNAEGMDETIKADAIFVMIGREAPLDFFRRSGVRIRGERTINWWITLILVLTSFVFIYHWKKPGVWLPIGDYFQSNGLFPYNVPQWLTGLSDAFANPANLLGTLNNSLASPGFYYSLMYCVVMLIFGIRRIRRRKTLYVTVQTWSLLAIQIIPLFILPYILLPWLGNNGAYDNGAMKWIADQLFPVVDWDPNGRAYYHAFGLILAWPLFVWNVFTEQPMWLWLGISLLQTFVIIPLMIHRWGKGAYCGWICSCGGMAETLGDAHRHKMPHGPIWNRLNMIGQVFLAVCFFLLFTRIISWVWPESFVGDLYHAVLKGIPVLNYGWFIDLLFAGILGFGLYFHFSGRMWCRFACPLAALMHIYARFSQFRIISEKSKCISCNVCTTVCHQGIDVMNFANKGLPMEDPQCVRCSACVQSCPTGVLQFGRINRKTGEVIARDRLAASPILMAEVTINGKRV